MVVLQNEASVRCGLKGQYWLQAGEDMLVLQDLETRRTVMEWPYKLLRRYGRDKVSRKILNVHYGNKKKFTLLFKSFHIF